MTDVAPLRRRFWLGEYDAVAVARMRIAFGAVVVYDLVERLRDFHTFYTGRGLITAGDYAELGAGIDGWSLLRLSSSTTAIAVLWAIAIAAFVGLTVGSTAPISSSASSCFGCSSSTAVRRSASTRSGDQAYGPRMAAR